MRTTLSLDDDLIDNARQVAEKLSTSFRAVVNEAVRIGLREVEKQATVKPYRTFSRPMGLRTGYDLDNVQELIARIEGGDAP